MDERYIKIKELNKARFDYFNEQVKNLEDEALKYLADDKIASGNRYVTDKLKLRDLKCEWLCAALPNHILFRLSVDDNYSSNDLEYLKQVMKDREYNLTIVECADYGYVFERSILLLYKEEKLRTQADTLAEEELRTQADTLAEEYCKNGCYDDYPNPSLAESIDIYDDIKDAFIAGYMAMNDEHKRIKKEHHAMKSGENCGNVFTEGFYGADLCCKLTRTKCTGCKDNWTFGLFD